MEYRFEQTATICFSVVADSLEEATEQAKVAVVDYLSVDGFGLQRRPEDMIPIANADGSVWSLPAEEQKFRETIGTDSPDIRCYVSEELDGLECVEEFGGEDEEESWPRQ